MCTAISSAAGRNNMLKEKYLVFFVLGAVLLNVMVLACLSLIGLRMDVKQHFTEWALGHAS